MTGEIEAGRIAPELRAEFPTLRLWSVCVAARPGRSHPGLRERLRALSDRMAGAQAIQLRTRPVPHAYRVFFRHIGLDPDTQRTPAEAAAVDRLFHGGHRSRGLLADALTIAVAETGVPVWALDDATLEPPLVLRPAGDHERLGRSEHASDARPGRLVIADARGPVAELFAEPAAGHRVGSETTVVRLVTVQPEGVPTIHVEEALWSVVEALEP